MDYEKFVREKWERRNSPLIATFIPNKYSIDNNVFLLSITIPLKIK